MCDLFSSQNARSVLQKKRILFLGDSNIRSFYKDTVFLLEKNQLLSSSSLKNKLGKVVSRDRIISNSPLHRGRDYYEVREYKHNDIHITFHFLTKCFTEVINKMFRSFKENQEFPDIIIMNSCLWDICRWGPNGVLDYKDNMVKLMKLIKLCLPDKTLFIWTCVPPISNRCRGGLLVKQVQFLEHSLRFDVMEGNMFARDIVVSHGFDVLDIHYYLRMQIHWRADDGVHWLPHAVRHVTNLLLTHISVAFNMKLPGNIKGQSIERFKSHAIKVIETQKVDLPNLSKLGSVIMAPQTKKIKSQSTRQFSDLMREEKIILSPLRKTIKEKIKHSKRNADKYYEGDSLMNVSVGSDEGNNSFVLDISFEAPAEPQYQGLGMSFESVPFDPSSITNSSISTFKEPQRSDLKGPVRFHAQDRRNRIRKVPYSYH